MIGRPHVPTRLKALRGTLRSDRANKNEPRPEVAAPNCPPHLNALAKKEWCRLVPELLKHGLLTKIDRAALAAYCVTYGRWIEAEVQLKTEGLTIKTPSGYEQASPWLSVANKALALMRSYASEFGLSPATRSRVSAVDPLKQPGEWDRFLNGED